MIRCETIVANHPVDDTDGYLEFWKLHKDATNRLLAEIAEVGGRVLGPVAESMCAVPAARRREDHRYL
jgi:hypothetical protein